MESEADGWYTNGSLINGRVGAEVYGLGIRPRKAHGTRPSIFQVQTHVIKECALEFAKKTSDRSKNLHNIRQSGFT